MTNLKQLRDYQEKINICVNKFLVSDAIRGQIYSPTGSGKTESFLHTINELRSILNLPKQKKLNIAIVHPRIALSQDQLKRFKEAFDTRFTTTSFHSGSHVRGNESVLERNTISPDQLEVIINECENNHITFSSYHSLHKIAHIEFDLMICDEAHNLVQDRFSPVLSQLKAKKILMYTATPITDETLKD